jgi:hypothetical protein
LIVLQQEPCQVWSNGDFFKEIFAFGTLLRGAILSFLTLYYVKMVGTVSLQKFDDIITGSLSYKNVGFIFEATFL